MEQAYNFSIPEVSQLDHKCEGKQKIPYPKKKDKKERKGEKNDFKDRTVLEQPELSQIQTDNLGRLIGIQQTTFSKIQIVLQLKGEIILKYLFPWWYLQ